jgi:hypothetical protein
VPSSRQIPEWRDEDFPQPLIPINGWGPITIGRLFVPYFVHRFNKPTTEDNHQIVARLHRVAAVTDAKLEKVRLLCGKNLPESCPTQTPFGHPMSMDKHNLTLEYAQWTGEQLAEKNPFWLRAIRDSVEDKRPAKN